MKLLAVDDEELNLTILRDTLADEGFEVCVAHDGKEALTVLNDNSDVGLILLDRMMPEMDGMTLFHTIRTDPRFLNVPVIMQTAMANKESIIEGIDAGVYHYLTKPYKREMLLAVVNAALRDIRRNGQYLAELKSLKETLRCIQTLEMECRTFDEGQRLAHFVAHCFPEPERVAVGLLELINNAIEHGNLEIGSEAKLRGLKDGSFFDERDRRLQQSPYNQRKVRLRFVREAEVLMVSVRDDGPGFNWQSFLGNSNYGSDSPLGHGITIASSISFDDLRYNAKGNEVEGRVRVGGS